MKISLVIDSESIEILFVTHQNLVNEHQFDMLSLSTDNELLRFTKPSVTILISLSETLVYNTNSNLKMLKLLATNFGW